MIFKSGKYEVDSIEKYDIKDIVEIYNSNRKFLKSHMNVDSVDIEWAEKEIQEMKEAGFQSVKIVDAEILKTVGFIDFKTSKEAYLSLMMIHGELKGKGIGKSVCRELEKHLLSEGCESIRIDVVTGYDDSVLEFWKKNGFEKTEDIRLNWNGNQLSAYTLQVLKNFYE